MPATWTSTGTWTQFGDSLTGTAGATITLPIGATASETVSIGLVASAVPSAITLEIDDPAGGANDVFVRVLESGSSLRSRAGSWAKTPFNGRELPRRISSACSARRCRSRAALPPLTTATATLAADTTGSIVLRMSPRPAHRSRGVLVVHSP